MTQPTVSVKALKEDRP